MTEDECLALVAELRAERDEAKRLMEMRHREMLAADELMRKHQRRADNAIAERDRLAADNARLAAQVQALTGAVTDIAKQKRTDELETEADAEFADFEGGYDACINVARAALDAATLAAMTPEDRALCERSLAVRDALKMVAEGRG